MITRKLYDSIELSTINNKQPLNVKPNYNDYLQAMVYYDDSWNKPVKGIISYHRGSGQNSSSVFPSKNTDWIVEGISKGFIIIYTRYWDNYPTKYTYNYNFPYHNSYFDTHEQQSFVAFIEDIVKKDSDFSKFITRNTKTILVGTSKGAGQIMKWSSLANTDFLKYKNTVLCCLVNNPSGGGSNYAKYDRVARVQGNLLNHINHPTKLLWSIGDTTHSIRSFTEAFYPYIENDLLNIDVYGEDATYTHTWQTTRMVEFINIAIDFFNECS